MPQENERNLGPQPLMDVMQVMGLDAQALVAASTEQLTHKMVARACKGRRLTPRVKAKVCAALNAASGRAHTVSELFNY